MNKKEVIETFLYKLDVEGPEYTIDNYLSEMVETFPEIKKSFNKHLETKAILKESIVNAIKSAVAEGIIDEDLVEEFNSFFY